MRIGYWFHLLFVVLLTAGGLAGVAAETYRYAYAPGPLPTMEPFVIRKFDLPGCYIQWIYHKESALLRVASDFTRRPNSLDPTQKLDLEGMGFGFQVWSDPRGFQCMVPPLALGPILLLYPAISLMLQTRRWLKTRGGLKPRCHRCDYDLTGNESGACPECGTATAARHPAVPGRLKRFIKNPARAGAASGMLLFASWFGMAAYREWRANTFDPSLDTSTPYSHYIARLRETGKPVTLHDIERLRPTIAQEVNGALIVEGLAEQLLALENGDREGVLFFDEELRKADLFVRVPESAIGPSKAFLEAHSALTERLGTLAASDGGRMSVFYGDGAANPLGLEMPKLGAWRIAAKLLALDVVGSAQTGNLDGAVNSVQLMAKLATTLDTEPSLITRLIQLSIDELTVRTLEVMLRAHELDQRIAQQLPDILARRLSQDSLKFTLQCERAFFFAICDGLAEGRLSMSDVTGEERAGRMSVSSIRENQLNGGVVFDRLIKVAEDPSALSRAAQEMDEGMLKTARSLGKVIGSHRLVLATIPSVSRAVELHNICLARLRCAAVALAADRYWAETGGWPTEAEALIPDYLDAVPIDPLNGDPLRLVATEGGLVIYSVGENLEDDGGSVVPAAGKRRGSDIGFRLSTERGVPAR